MRIPKRRKSKDEDIDDADDNRPVRFEALAELTSSEVVEQVKMGMSQLAPLTDEIDEDIASDEEAA